MRPRAFLPPLVWVAAAIAAGIAAHARWPMPPAVGAVALAVLLVAWAVVMRWGRPAHATALALCACGALGVVHAAAADARQPRWPVVADGRAVEIRGTLRAGPEPGPHGWWATVRVGAVRVGHPVTRGRPSERAAHDPSGPMQVALGLVRITGRGLPPAARSGDEVVVRGRFRLGRPAGNPGERAERDALRRRGLVGVVVLDRDRGLVVTRRARWTPRAAIGAARRQIVEVVRRTQPDPHAALLLSLLLGIDAFLAPDLYQRFTQAGWST